MSWILVVLLSVQGSQEETQKRLQQVEKELEELKKKVDHPQETTAGQDLPDKAQDVRRDAGEVYSKPFLARFGRNVYLGGYMDIEYIGTEESNSDTFDQHRLVPFIYADVSKQIKVATEIEIEHGAELGVEFAHIDYWLSDAFNIRAGILLDPLGRFNLVHDAPFQDLTLRPLVDQTVIPAVLREPGAGFFGKFDADPWEFQYEIYLTNGFKGLSKSASDTPTINRTTGLKSARASENPFSTSAYRDFNDNKAVVGRFSASPFLGLEAGVSTHIGKYDERGDNQLAIYAVDLTMRLGGVARAIGIGADFFGPFELVGEWARADIERDTYAKSEGVPDDLEGGFGEIRYHFMPEFLRQAIPGANEESTFTLVYRFDSLDLDRNKRRYHTIGLNFRPREDTVIKFEYQIRKEDGDLADTDDDTFAASLATYF